jgi:DnaJ-class molecular chaperone
MVGSWLSSSLSSKNHYDTLNVKRDASVEEIKSRFRQLSLETHPDTARNNNNNNNDNTTCEQAQEALKRENVERFKQISHAASILTNKTKREMYDLELEQRQRLFTPHVLNEHRGSSLFHNARPRRKVNGQQASTGFQVFLEQVFRPRNMILGSVAIYAFVTYYSSTNDYNKKQPRMMERGQPGVVAERVQAWKNPQTGQWEQPAPWDPVYRNLKPTLELVPREQVRSRTR